MSSLAYKDLEFQGTAAEGQRQTKTLKPFAVVSSRLQAGDQVALRVAEVLDYELERGSMPA